MAETILFFVVAVIVIGLIPIAPHVLRLRIMVLRFVRLNWFADWHERNFSGFVVGARITLAAIAVVLLALGLNRL